MTRIPTKSGHPQRDRGRPAERFVAPHEDHRADAVRAASRSRARLVRSPALASGSSRVRPEFFDGPPVVFARYACAVGVVQGVVCAGPFGPMSRVHVGPVIFSADRADRTACEDLASFQIAGCGGSFRDGNDVGMTWSTSPRATDTAQVSELQTPCGGVGMSAERSARCPGVLDPNSDAAEITLPMLTCTGRI